MLLLPSSAAHSICFAGKTLKNIVFKMNFSPHRNEVTQAWCEARHARNCLRGTQRLQMHVTALGARKCRQLPQCMLLIKIHPPDPYPRNVSQCRQPFTMHESDQDARNFRDTCICSCCNQKFTINLYIENWQKHKTNKIATFFVYICMKKGRKEM